MHVSKSKFRLTVSRRLYIAFFILISLFIINGIISLSVLYNNKSKADKITDEIEPSLRAIDEFHLMLIQSKMLATNWVYLRTKEDDKLALKAIHETTYPTFKKNLTSITKNWDATLDVQTMDTIQNSFENLLKIEKRIMDGLSTFESYDDAMVKLESESTIEENVLPQTATMISALEKIKLRKLQEKKEAEESLASSTALLITVIILLAILLVIISFIVAVYLAGTIIKPIVKVKDRINELGKGKLVVIDDKIRDDEIGDMIQSVGVLVEGLKYTSEFAQNVGNSKFDTQYQALSADDELGLSLLTMRDNLKKAAEDDRRRNWSSSGLAQLGELLRANYDTSAELYEKVMSFIIKYVNTNQGKLFEINEDNARKELHLVACYAYNRKKFLSQSFEFGEGLVGQCAEENDKIYLTDVPDNYIKITSGLGEANPNCILIVPMRVVDKVYGVLEIASFKVLEAFEVEFIEKVAESIASSISTIKNNERTKKLLEESQMQSEQLRSQEEEMRQNMEELHATQEEMERKQIEMEKKLKNLNIQ